MNKSILMLLALLCAVACDDIDPGLAPATNRSIQISTGECKRCVEPIETRKVALIVEPRQMPSLVPAVLNTIQRLPPEWLIQIFHGVGNEHFLKTNGALREHIDSGKIILSRMNVDNLSVSDYNGKIMLNADFWDIKVLGEMVLIFEADTVLCSGAQRQIKDYLQFDYVGAPWSYNLTCSIYQKANESVKRVILHNANNDTYLQDVAKKHEITGTYSYWGMNSGLSLVKRSKILSLLRSYVPETPSFANQANDYYFGCLAMVPEANIKMPTREQATEFSVESVYHPAPLGVHKPWPYLKTEELRSLEQSCPEINQILRPAYHFGS
jgi:hypothetical protein